MALLRLRSSTSRFEYIASVCLPKKGLDLRGLQAVVADWNKVRPSTDLLDTSLLRTIAVTILDKDECMLWHKTKKIQVELEDEMMCAGGGA